MRVREGFRPPGEVLEEGGGGGENFATKSPQNPDGSIHGLSTAYRRLIDGLSTAYRYQHEGIFWEKAGSENSRARRKDLTKARSLL